VIAWRILRDLGADVTALYPPAHPGDPMLVGIGTRTDSGGTSSLTALLADADALVVDRPGLERLRATGLEPEDLAVQWPRLVVACISPFGLSGPWAGLNGGEAIVQAASGVLMSNGDDNDPPLPAGIPIAALGGGMLGACAVTAALYECAHSGCGQFIDHAEYDSMVTFSGTLLPRYFLTGQSGRRLGNRHAMAAPWNAYPTRDSWLIICTMNDAQFRALAEAIGRPDLLVDPRYQSASLRVQHVTPLDDAVTEWSRARSTRDAVELLRANGIAAGPIQTVHEVLIDPHARYRGVIPSEEARASGPFLRFSRAGEAHSAAGRPAADSSAADGERAPRPASQGKGLGPLAGVRVIEVSGHTAGPLAGRLLALLGAEVIKVEPPGGEAARHLAQQVAGQGYLFHVNNTDKLDVTLDVMAEQNRPALEKLLGSGDAFLTNLAPATLAAAGLGPDDLCKRHPGLVYTGLSGFGADGPRGGQKTFDMVVQALSGVMSLTANPAGQPRKVAMSVADLFGACSAAIGTAAALVERTRSGRGCFVDATLFDATVWATQEAWHRQCPQSSGYVRTADGWVVVEGDPAQPLASGTADSDAIADGVGADNGQPATDEFARLTSDECEALCARAGVAALQPRRIDEVAEAEQTVARGLIVEVEYAGHPIKVIGSPFHFSRTPSAVRAAAPELGADNGTVFASAERR
jgi:crotonobetainyl-CoA:carnitine CoA-transferase CaiB-like acyl-CoA transferase